MTTESLKNLGISDSDPSAQFKGMDLLTAKEAAIALLHSRMITPNSGYRNIGIDKHGLMSGPAFALTRGRVRVNYKYFGPGRRNTLLNSMQKYHAKGSVLGGGQYGAATVIFHEVEHTNTGRAEFLHNPKNEKGKISLSADSRGCTKDPTIIEGLGGHAGDSYAERWAMSATMVAFYGTKAPWIAQQTWVQGVAMDAGDWGAVDRQAANLRQSLDYLYTHTNPGNGRPLTPGQVEVRKKCIAASLGFGKPWTPGQPLPELNPVVHGVNVLPQRERPRVAPELPDR
ncbi:hypothetical protein ACIBSV_42235 [Embleya sp. NPDC050154]|uniref:hypothetical protein n=1 Tax=Embleya sp. NPDC050154 TaxID=3363988 RepID=UPI0037A2505C